MSTANPAPEDPSHQDDEDEFNYWSDLERPSSPPSSSAWTPLLAKPKNNSDYGGRNCSSASCTEQQLSNAGLHRSFHATVVVPQLRPVNDDDTTNQNKNKQEEMIVVVGGKLSAIDSNAGGDSSRQSCCTDSVLICNPNHCDFDSSSSLLSSSSSTTTSASTFWREGPRLHDPRYGLVAVFCNYALYAIGGYNLLKKQYLATIERIPLCELLTTGSAETTETPPPTPSRITTTKTVQNGNQTTKITTITSSPSSSAATATTSTRSGWTRLSTCLSSPRKGATAAVVYNRFIVILGGTSNGRNRILSVDVIDTGVVSNRIQFHHEAVVTVSAAGPRLIRSRLYAGAAVVAIQEPSKSDCHLKLFILGGINAQGHRVDTVQSLNLAKTSSARISSAAELFDSSSTWKEEDGSLRLQTARAGHAVTAVKSCLVVAGGQGNDDSYLPSVEVLDTKRRVVWRLPDLTLPRYGCSILSTTLNLSSSSLTPNHYYQYNVDCHATTGTSLLVIGGCCGTDNNNIINDDPTRCCAEYLNVAPKQWGKHLQYKQHLRKPSHVLDNDSRVFQTRSCKPATPIFIPKDQEVDAEVYIGEMDQRAAKHNHSPLLERKSWHGQDTHPNNNGDNNKSPQPHLKLEGQSWHDHSNDSNKNQTPQYHHHHHLARSLASNFVDNDPQPKKTHSPCSLPWYADAGGGRPKVGDWRNSAGVNNDSKMPSSALPPASPVVNQQHFVPGTPPLVAKQHQFTMLPVSPVPVSMLPVSQVPVSQVSVSPISPKRPGSRLMPSLSPPLPIRQHLIPAEAKHFVLPESTAATNLSYVPASPVAAKLHSLVPASPVPSSPDVVIRQSFRSPQQPEQHSPSSAGIESLPSPLAVPVYRPVIWQSPRQQQSSLIANPENAAKSPMSLAVPIPAPIAAPTHRARHLSWQAGQNPNAPERPSVAKSLHHSLQPARDVRGYYSPTVTLEQVHQQSWEQSHDVSDNCHTVTTEQPSTNRRSTTDFSGGPRPLTAPTWHQNTTWSSEKEKRLKVEREKLLRVVRTTSKKPCHVSEEYVDEILTDQKLGKGFFGVVYKGKDKELRKVFAVKMIPPETLRCGHSMDVQRASETFHCELDTLNNFRHPNIACLFAYHFPTNARGRHMLVYELAENGSLDRFWTSDLGRERLSSVQRRVQIALEIMTAIRFLHVGGKEISKCFHRDIKSANVCLTRDLTAKLIDCGLAKFVTEEQAQIKMSSNPKGTTGYTCPKYQQGALLNFEEACDIFSFGVVLAELWTGKLQNHRSERSGNRAVNFYEEYVNKGVSPINDMDALLDVHLKRSVEQEEIMGHDGRTDPLGCGGKNDDSIIPGHFKEFAFLAISCMSTDPRKRPRGDKIIRDLRRIHQECVEYDERRSAFCCLTETHAATTSAACQSNTVYVTCDACKELNYCRQSEDGHSFCVASCWKTVQVGKFVTEAYGKQSELAETQRRTIHALNNAILPSLARLEAESIHPIPRLFILVPPKIIKTKLLRSTWLLGKVQQRLCLHFVCAHSAEAVSPPIELTATREWVRKIAPALVFSLRLLALTSAAVISGLSMMTVNILPGLSGLGGGMLGQALQESLEMKHLIGMVEDVEDMLRKEGDGGIVDRIHQQKLTNEDIQRMNNDSLGLIAERAMSNPGWMKERLECERNIKRVCSG
ncbi:hypothetical protein ACA910_021492 [Epithemia clementina (nom. ined.)]